MQKEHCLRPIGRVRHTEDGTKVALEDGYAEGLAGLGDFSHVQVLWFCHRSAPESAALRVPKPYRSAPETLGVFATRSPVRPNPVALSVARVLRIDEGGGEVLVDWLDAEDGSPVLDLKPYTPSLDRVEHPGVPDWCAHWPGCVEESGQFDWEGEMVY